MTLPRARSFATRRVERLGRMLEVTGAERTLVEGFQRPKLVGGLEELVVSATGFASLDLDLLQSILDRYAVAQLWAATGWFLERTQASFHPSDRLLDRWATKRPSSPQYLERSRRGGVLAPRWNLIVPEALERLAERDER
jgi:predicted transcriptional regulator of viral defense system